MNQTDMAVVVSQAQNEIRDMKEKGLDIRPHRKRMVVEDLDTKFKDPDDPFRLVFVCAMWMTGFDVPSCSTIYLDKPMRNHTLMQAIARDLLNTLKSEKLVLDWRKRQRSRAQVRVTIEKMLDRGLPETHTRELFQQKTEAIFQHIYESYYGGGRGIYAAVM